ncbi:hypothetical protein SAMN05660909_04581 [Chitinophaga terrae (ex Kim and Jung 2007)]|uniref:Uncharacterized protein n=1 Tax=Chitinophaga terrae (ex Kim and Jung 2007) TaxID=408074 RepID=A0A1H4FP98_9BACT|nr:hypothetical protein [Chitinophaga terrae (ex Kim and Jung 2007)]MDQ0109667.1 hypothetical protein [Chitinophaga terrae (ex Kim and Jung 2007)]GEP92636.1 hypothetical protein CTE07_42810 [Chitinophaga terrae (ex Kim and Jung 2007)]SEA99203.1 hypothetical protein SAMN05660909_04581 [Chitinophaga terrae (ex Kim and Jung 2007)]
MMTDFILSERLLPEEEVIRLQQNTPTDIIRNQKVCRNAQKYLSWYDFLELFTEEDGLEDVGHHCNTCRMI